MFAGADAGFELRSGRCRNALTIPAILSILIHQKNRHIFTPVPSAAQRRLSGRRGGGASRRAPTGGADRLDGLTNKYTRNDT